jgi:ATP-dependent helicase/nuclease subunit A
MTDPIQAATAIQQRAADPARSVAVRASAGAGKTKVLVDRFLRLCIEDGPGRSHPRSILAVTFTRKAAVEIQERLLKRARDLALADETTLTRMLSELFRGRENPAPSAVEKEAAANLLEKVLEDVAGLHVGTIHSFCQLILGRFAAEAGLDPHFSVLENPDDLIDEALDELEREMTSDAELRDAAATVASNPLGVRSVLRGIMPEQMRLGRWLGVHRSRPGARADLLPALLDDLKTFLFPDLALAGDPDVAAFLPALADELEAFAGPGVTHIRSQLGVDLGTVGPKNVDQLEDGAAAVATELRAALSSSEVEPLRAAELVTAARKIFLTAKNTTRSFTRMRKDPELKERFNALISAQALGVLGVLHRLGYIQLYILNRDLLRLSLRLLDLYAGLKQRDRVVDFQDLEDLARRLMGDEGSVGALLYRLDDSLHHILLDEFQDTNFNQWDMLRPFVDEFLSGDADGRRRTLFFVGDAKQSIYGFRGAEPHIFADACTLLQERGLPVENLPTNFRSLGHIVGGVGCLFSAPPLADALPVRERDQVRQAWARPEASGQVLVLPPFTAAKDDESASPTADSRSGDQLAAQAAVQLVQQLKQDPDVLTWEGFGPDLTSRRLRWDDFLVLARSRTEISLYEKAFADAGIPFVPPGRGMLAASREVQDILALLRWLLWPEDDPALATVLRSPLFRLDEAAFQKLLAARGLLRPSDVKGRYRAPDNLWPTLKKMGNHGSYERPLRLLKSWRKHLGFETCHDLLRRIYRDGDVLARFGAARGDQARYNLLRLYDLALRPEIAGTPTVRQLADFLDVAAGRGGQEEGALPSTEGEGRVRFMTVHAAKGLEAPVVLLVDADRAAGRESPRVRLAPTAPDTPLLFKVTKDLRDGFTLPDSVAWPRDPLQRVSEVARRRDRAEEANLLYVAMTRARDRLVVLGGDRESGADFDSPLRQIQRGVAAGGCDSQIQLEDPPGLSRPPEPFDPMPGAVSAASGDDAQVWQPPPPRELMKVTTPSGSADDTADDLVLAVTSARQDETDPTERGQTVHQLLQLATELGAMPPGSSDCHAEAAAVFSDPALDWIFRPEQQGGQGWSEVPLIRRRPGVGAAAVEERLTGVVDRLIVRPDRVDIIDYKTNRFGGDDHVRENLIAHYRPQLRAYHEAVVQIYPDRPVHTWLLFTEPGLSADQRPEEVAQS